MTRLWSRLRFLFNVRKSIPFLKAFFTAKEVAAAKKVTAIALIVLYFVFPFDLVPDFLIGIGIVDDLAVATLILQLIIKMAPAHIKAKYAIDRNDNKVIDI
ncbi:YkvA family protein [Terribacillus sp. 7520-G]|uniref:YkvA family protein n=1 Tax=Terribacillus sp. 7520-G TaxID=2025389 RepID=UPI000BA77B16|nr:DUF1232 domain-containing protein [Terribacillus sp. 7520-G]PAD37714.1 hypothetical protein CHH53_14925 [Terribacillus sp. 7520-G]